MERFFKHCKAIVYHVKFIMDHWKLIKELKAWQYELEAGDPKIAKLDDVIIRLERRHLDSNNKINTIIEYNKIKSGS